MRQIPGIECVVKKRRQWKGAPSGCRMRKTGLGRGGGRATMPAAQTNRRSLRHESQRVNYRLWRQRRLQLTSDGRHHLGTSEESGNGSRGEMSWEDGG